MRNETRIAYNGYLAQVAKLNGVDSAAVKFNVEPSVQQNLETAIQESTALLGRINVIGVMEQSGEALLLGVNGPIASRTDTAGGNRRNPGEHQALSKDDYTCKQTNFDSAFRYVLLDAWAKFPDFQTRLTAAIAQRQALDRLMIGWNGVSAAAATNAATYPLRQDVNIGWLQKMRTENAPRVMKEIKEGTDKIAIGAGKDFTNLDALVFSMVEEFIAPWYQEDPDLVVICGRQLLADKYFPIINKDNAPTEMLAADIVTSQKRLGNLPAVRVPYFPARGLLVTKLENLSIYWQEGSRRRTVLDNAKRDRIENYESVNDAYVIEDLECAALAENIEIAS